MIGRVGEKETGTPLLNSISKMSLFRLLSSCLPIIEPNSAYTPDKDYLIVGSTEKWRNLKREDPDGSIKCPFYAICKYKSFNFNHMRTHIRRHTDERPFSCKICNQSFQRKPICINHIRTHRQGFNDRPVNWSSSDTF